MVVVALVGLVSLIWPLPLGWLRYRAVSAALLLSSLMFAGSISDQSVGNVAQSADDDRGTMQVAAASASASSGQSSQSNHANESAAPNPLADKNKQAIWIAVSQDAVRARLKDPDSAEFRKVFFNAYKDTTPVVCGEVNGKNSFGGYSGYQHFLASGETLVFLETGMPANEFAKAWNEMCLG